MCEIDKDSSHSGKCSSAENCSKGMEWSDEKTRAGRNEQQVVDWNEERLEDDGGEEEGGTNESTPQKGRLYLMVCRVTIHHQSCKHSDTQSYRGDKYIHTGDGRMGREHTQFSNYEGCSLSGEQRL